MTEPLSPAAQAILTAKAKQRCLNEWDHVNDPPCHPSDNDWNGCYQCVDRRGLAAALRAVVQELKYFGITEKNILAIAAELEGADD
jgi:hypothetical protein